MVALSLVGSYGVSRAARLPHRMAVLIACGNSICGNSAIAAVASVIGATGREIASAIAFTAILGVVVVLALPLLVPVLDLSAGQYGVLAGLTVYAVPQVLAATAPFGSLSMQVGTLVKLLRVLMLGPVVLLLSVGMRGNAGTDPVRTGVPWRPGRFIPWFIIGFLLAAVLNFNGFGAATDAQALAVHCRPADYCRHGCIGARAWICVLGPYRPAGHAGGGRIAAAPDRP